MRRNSRITEEIAEELRQIDRQIDDNAAHDIVTAEVLRTELEQKTKVIDSVTILCQGCFQPLQQKQ